MQLYSWLLNIVDAFLKTHQDMKGTLPEAREVLDLHKQLFSDLNVRCSQYRNREYKNKRRRRKQT